MAREEFMRGGEELPSDRTIKVVLPLPLYARYHRFNQMKCHTTDKCVHRGFPHRASFVTRRRRQLPSEQTHSIKHPIVGI
ncbi:hypothetical protein PsorP6_015103 [Peronosclerospora sorghi]|uniref:Uncharacterized protein n=1 Tax=Peronosclerospora sorghi TaxID=230839 RepID=A0ACC0VUP7_9STRA|nr:hypothetical protein PsorP6_015103 [Peronosclerospora sorghi]